MHVSSGVTGLICAIFLGRRIGFDREPMKPHNLVMAFAGACLLWIGWFGFNAGSTLSANGLATNAFMATHFAAAAAGSLLLLTLIDRIMGVRSSAVDEVCGLDESYLGELGYVLSASALSISIDDTDVELTSSTINIKELDRNDFTHQPVIEI